MCPSGSQVPARALSEAILRALLYADVFAYPLSVEEIHRYLVGVPAPLAAVRAALQGDPWLQARVTTHGPLVALAGREEAFARRAQREASSAPLWRHVRRYATLLALIPFVRMVAVTGSLAVHSARAPNDDIDLFVVTTPGRLWLSRLFLVSLARLGGLLAGAQLCPNYLVTLDTLAQGDASLFTAHELFQMRPLYGAPVYQQLLAVNAWARAYLPNSEAQAAPLAGRHLAWPWRWLKATGEGLLSGRLGDALERWERGRKLRRLQASAVGATGAVFSPNCCKGHMQDHGRRITHAYRQRLQAAGLDDQSPAGAEVA